MKNEKKKLKDLNNSKKVKKFSLKDLNHIKGGGVSGTESAAFIVVMDCW